MHKPKGDEYFYPGAENMGMAILDQAQMEVRYEEFRKAVEDKKTELLTKKPWYVKVWPYRVHIERVK